VKKNRVIVSVINDLATDQRVKKVCGTLKAMGYDILLIGRKLKGSMPIDNRSYKVKRMRLLFNKGPFFYMCFNIRLFFLLLFSRGHILHANDLDTLLPNYLVSKLKRMPLVYDAHELFTEVPELTKRPRVQRIWNRIEKQIFPRLKFVFTVNDSIAEIYEKKYGVKVHVLRNFPETGGHIVKGKPGDFGLDPSKKIVILQGAGINIERGAEELLEAMKEIEGAVLVVAGSGDVLPYLRKKADEKQLQGKVVFFNKMPWDKLMQLTSCADLGVTLDKDTNLNYRFSLPNKLFDYIRAGVPVLASNLPEIRKIVELYRVGLIVESHSPVEIAKKMKEMLFEIPRSQWTEELAEASDRLCWENEQHKLMAVYEQIK
jgi:glycosyltransferase involved in cell wall biosynthesis